MDRIEPAGSIRRRVLRGAGASIGLAIVAGHLAPDAWSAGGLTEAVAAFTEGARPTPGRVQLEIAELVENGNAVPVAVTVESPMTGADHVTAIALFTERNPQSEVARFDIGPRAGRAKVSTRMRLATSQKVQAVARMSDGSFWSQTVDVVVLLAACIE